MAKILIVDDDPSMLSFLSKALENAGHNIIAHDNGQDALDTLINMSDFDLLLSDVVMPGMDGIELSKKAVEHLPDLKIMFITGFSASLISGPKTANMSNKVIPKPFHLNDLVARVEKILQE